MCLYMPSWFANINGVPSVCFFNAGPLDNKLHSVFLGIDSGFRAKYI